MSNIFYNVGYLIGLAIAAAVAFWVYKDATKQGSNHVFLWTIGTFAILIVFLPLYFIFRPKAKTQSAEMLIPNENSVTESIKPVSNTEEEARELSLLGSAGVMQERQFPLPDRPIAIGTDSSVCSIVYPKGTPGVSSLHCQIVPHFSGWILVDFSETGTWLNGERMENKKPHVLKKGDAFYLGNRENSFIVQASV